MRYHPLRFKMSPLIISLDSNARWLPSLETTCMLSHSQRFQFRRKRRAAAGHFCDLIVHCNDKIRRHIAQATLPCADHSAQVLATRGRRAIAHRRAGWHGVLPTHFDQHRTARLLTSGAVDPAGRQTVRRCRSSPMQRRRVRNSTPITPTGSLASTYLPFVVRDRTGFCTAGAFESVTVIRPAMRPNANLLCGRTNTDAVAVSTNAVINASSAVNHQ